MAGVAVALVMRRTTAGRSVRAERCIYPVDMYERLEADVHVDDGMIHLENEDRNCQQMRGNSERTSP